MSRPSSSMRIAAPRMLAWRFLPEPVSRISVPGLSFGASTPGRMAESR
jgi:hypothetical protein